MTTNQINLTAMTQTELSQQLAEIEAQRAALLAQLEVVGKADAIAAKLIESIKAELDELEDAALNSVVGKLAEFLQPYGLNTIAKTEDVNPSAKGTRKRGQVESVGSIPGLVKLGKRFGAVNDGDATYTAYIGVDNRRATKIRTGTGLKISATTKDWGDYIKKQYHVTPDILNNHTDQLTGLYLVKTSGLNIRDVAELANFNFAVLPDDEENKLNASKEPKTLNKNLQLVDSASVNTDDSTEDEGDSGDELITEEVMETEPIKVVPAPTPSNDDDELPDYTPESLIGKHITTSAYGKEMTGTLTGYHPERGEKCFSAKLDELPIEAWLPDGSFEVINSTSTELDLASLPM